MKGKEPQDPLKVLEERETGLIIVDRLWILNG